MILLAFKTCLACVLVASAYEDLSYNKVATQSPIYPTSSTFYIARNAVDRNPSTCMRTEEIGRHSPYKTMWWNVDLGGVYNIYSINILFKNYDGFENRQQGRFAGFSLYVSNTGDISMSTLCYKDGPQLPPLNFTAVCTEYGRYVIFYNERLDSVTYPDGYELLNMYTELCEVVVQGCKRHGYYGSTCSNLCSANCSKNSCHIHDGTCFSCKPGWSGKFCHTVCDEMWYGENCGQRCAGHCKDNDTCNHVTGQCDRGCDAGWTQSECDKECSDGTYGFGCLNNCSGHCLNESSCDKHNGQCKSGCNPGYTNMHCNEQVLQSSSDKKETSTSTVFLLISLTINIVFVTCCFLLIWGLYTRRVSILGFNPSCWKRSDHYADTDIKADENTNYQELGSPRENIAITYQNTALR